MPVGRHPYHPSFHNRRHCSVDDRRPHSCCTGSTDHLRTSRICILFVHSRQFWWMQSYHCMRRNRSFHGFLRLRSIGSYNRSSRCKIWLSTYKLNWGLRNLNSRHQSRSWHGRSSRCRKSHHKSKPWKLSRSGSERTNSWKTGTR